MTVKCKLVEGAEYKNAFRPERLGAETVFYNGQSITTGAIMFDTQNFDEIDFVCNYGTCVGAAVTISNAIYESDTNNPTASSLLTGASFTDVNSSNDEAVQIAAVQCKDTKRYIALRTEVQGTAPTIDFSAVAILGKPNNQAVSNVTIFDV